MLTKTNELKKIMLIPRLKNILFIHSVSLNVIMYDVIVVKLTLAYDNLNDKCINNGAILFIDKMYKK